MQDYACVGGYLCRLSYVMCSHLFEAHLELFPVFDYIHKRLSLLCALKIATIPCEQIQYLLGKYCYLVDGQNYNFLDITSWVYGQF